jgi:endonuclease YncB( thermonuclease family)
MDEVVLDASAMLALFNQEEGCDVVDQCLDQGVMSTVNLSEVIAKLVDKNVPESLIREFVSQLKVRIIPVDQEQAMIAGLLRLQTIIPSILILGTVSIATPAWADFNARVVSIGDGDTLTVQGPAQKTTLRLACVDAPEQAQAPWGQTATARLKSLIPVGSTIQVRDIETDRYGRTIAEVFVRGESINLSLVKTGHAVVYVRTYIALSESV